MINALINFSDSINTMISVYITQISFLRTSINPNAQNVDGFDWKLNRSVITEFYIQNEFGKKSSIF